MEAGQLTVINANAVSPETIFSKGSIQNFRAWNMTVVTGQATGRNLGIISPNLIRLFTSLYPPWSIDIDEEELLPRNVEILKSFVHSVTQAGSIPLIVYFPNRIDLNQQDPSLLLGRRVLKEAGLPYVDLTSCLPEVTPSVRFQRGGHYSPQSNVAVAKCLVDAVREALDQPLVAWG